MKWLYQNNSHYNQTEELAYRLELDKKRTRKRGNQNPQDRQHNDQKKRNKQRATNTTQKTNISDQREHNIMTGLFGLGHPPRNSVCIDHASNLP